MKSCLKTPNAISATWLYYFTRLTLPSKSFRLVHFPPHRKDQGTSHHVYRPPLCVQNVVGSPSNRRLCALWNWLRSIPDKGIKRKSVTLINIIVRGCVNIGGQSSRLQAIHDRFEKGNTGYDDAKIQMDFRRDGRFEIVVRAIWRP